MSYRVKFKRKKAVDGLSTLSCWCYEIEASGNDTIDKGEWGIDFADDIKIEDPTHYDECNDYEVDSKKVKGKSVVHKPNASDQVKSIQICFIASSEEATGTKISLEYSQQKWTDGWHWEEKEIEGTGEVVGPKAMADFRSENGSDEMMASLAKFEAIKLGHLLSSAWARVC